MYEKNKKGLKGLEETLGAGAREGAEREEAFKEFMRGKKSGSFVKATDIGNDAQVEIQGNGIAIMALSLSINKHVLELVGADDEDLAKAYVSAIIDMVTKYVQKHLKGMGGDDE